MANQISHTTKIRNNQIALIWCACSIVHQRIDHCRDVAPVNMKHQDTGAKRKAAVDDQLRERPWEHARRAIVMIFKTVWVLNHLQWLRVSLWYSMLADKFGELCLGVSNENRFFVLTDLIVIETKLWWEYKILITTWFLVHYTCEMRKGQEIVAIAVSTVIILMTTNVFVPGSAKHFYLRSEAILIVIKKLSKH